MAMTMGTRRKGTRRPTLGARSRMHEKGVTSESSSEKLLCSSLPLAWAPVSLTRIRFRAKRIAGIKRGVRWPLREPWFALCTISLAILASTLHTGFTDTSVARNGPIVHFNPLDGSSNASASSNGSSQLTPGTIPPFTGSWPAYMFAMNRTGYNNGENTLSRANASQIGLQWNVTLPGPVVASPTEANGVVYVGAWDGNEYALSAATGAMVWSKPTFLGVENFSGETSYGEPWLSPLGISAATTVVGNNLYVGAFHNLYRLNAQTGAILNNTTIYNVSAGTNPVAFGLYTWSSPTIYNGNVYIGISSQADHPLVPGGVDMFNATTLHWEAQWFSYDKLFGGSVWSTPTLEVNNGIVWVTTGNGGNAQNAYSAESIVALNATTLKEEGKWTVSGSAPDLDFGAGVTLFTAHNWPHYVVATNKDGYAYALNGSKLSSGLAWSDKTTTFPGASTCQPPGQALSPGAWDGSEVYLGSSYTTVGGVNVNGSVRAVYPNNGSYRWQEAAPGTVQGGLAAADGIVAAASRLYQYHTVSGCPSYTGTNDSWLQLFNSSSGQQLLRYFFGYPVVSAPTIADGRIFVTATINDTTYWNTVRNHLGHVYAFGLPLGAPTQVRPLVTYSSTFGEEIGGVLAYGNATGGMPSYGDMGWTWGNGGAVSGHGGNYWYFPPVASSYTASFSFIDARNYQDGATWNVYLKYTVCNSGTYSYYCALVAVNQCHYFLGYCYNGFINPTLFIGGINGIVIVSWDWNFGDGTPDSHVATPSHTYSSHGSYTVTLTVTDSEERQYVQTLEVTT